MIARVVPRRPVAWAFRPSAAGLRALVHLLLRNPRGPAQWIRPYVFAYVHCPRFLTLANIVQTCDHERSGLAPSVFYYFRNGFYFFLLLPARWNTVGRYYLLLEGKKHNHYPDRPEPRSKTAVWGNVRDENVSWRKPLRTPVATVTADFRTFPTPSARSNFSKFDSSDGPAPKRSFSGRRRLEVGLTRVRKIFAAGLLTPAKMEIYFDGRNIERRYNGYLSRTR